MASDRPGALVAVTVAEAKPAWRGLVNEDTRVEGGVGERDAVQGVDGVGVRTDGVGGDGSVAGGRVGGEWGEVRGGAGASLRVATGIGVGPVGKVSVGDGDQACHLGFSLEAMPWQLQQSTHIV